MTITLPFPPAVLSPNSRVHWAKKAKAARVYKSDCVWALLPYKKLFQGKASFLLTFHPPDNHRRDLDNMVAAMKHGLDALSFVCGVDDSQFQLTIAKGEPTKGGCVEIVAL